MQTALVTGASSGTGRHLARHPLPLALVAPLPAELEGVAVEVRTEFEAGGRVAAADPDRPDAARDLFEALEVSAVAVDLRVVVDTGQGQEALCREIPVQRHLPGQRLDAEDVLRLVALFLPPMPRRGGGRVPDVASLTGFEPKPSMVTDHAVKASVPSRSEGFASELADTPVPVPMCPGSADAGFFPKTDLEQPRGIRKAIPMAPQDVAAEGDRVLPRGEGPPVPNARNTRMAASRRLTSDALQATRHERMSAAIPPDGRQRRRGDREDTHALR